MTAKRATPDWHVPTPTALRLPSGESVAAVATPRDKPLVAGSRNSAARARSGATYAWGWNSHDTLGLDTDEEWIPTPRRVEFEKQFKTVSLGGWHAVALDGDGTAWAWGGNEYGQAGVRGDARDERHAGVHVSEHVSVPARVAFSESLRENENVRERDDTSTTRVPAPKIKITQVACGGMNSFALVRDDDSQKDDSKKETVTVFEWGARAGSEKEHARAPVAVPFHLPVAEQVVSLAAGMFHVLALTSHGRVFAWGKGDYGQLGLGRPGNWDAPKEVAPLSDKAVVFVAAGGWHSCALAADGACFTWGRGEYGRLGMAEDQADKQRPTEVAFEPDAFEEADGAPGGLRRKNKTIVDAALGGSHTCFLDARGAVWSVGRNNHGRLGRVVHGKWTGAPGRVVFPPPRGGGEWVCESIVAGGRHTLAVARAV